MRLLILSASVGAGHVRAGDALLQAASAQGEGVVAEHWDVLEYTAPVYRRVYADGYLRVVDQAPALWGYLYARANQARGAAEPPGLVKAFDRVHFHRFREAVQGFAPDCILATHFLPVQVLHSARQSVDDGPPLGLVLTDFDAHALWVQKGANRFFVGCEELVAILADRGIPAERVVTTGIPIDRRFAQPPDRASARMTLDLPSDRPVLLVMGGGFGTGGLLDTAEAGLEVPDAEVLAVAGRNGKLEAALRERAARSDGRLQVRGFVTDVPQLMAAADLIVTKSGGLTTSECLAMGLPMLVRDPTPGQEERNCDFVMEAGAAWKAHGAGSTRYKLRRLLADPERLAAMSRAARGISHPAAADAVIESVLE